MFIVQKRRSMYYVHHGISGPNLNDLLNNCNSEGMSDCHGSLISY